MPTGWVAPLVTGPYRGLLDGPWVEERDPWRTAHGSVLSARPSGPGSQGRLLKYFFNTCVLVGAKSGEKFLGCLDGRTLRTGHYLQLVVRPSLARRSFLGEILFRNFFGFPGVIQIYTRADVHLCHVLYL